MNTKAMVKDKIELYLHQQTYYKKFHNPKQIHQIENKLQILKIKHLEIYNKCISNKS